MPYFKINVLVNHTPHSYVISQPFEEWVAMNDAHRAANAASIPNRITVLDHEEVSEVVYSTCRNVVNYGKPSSAERLARRAVIFCDADWRDPPVMPALDEPENVVPLNPANPSQEEEDQ